MPFIPEDKYQKYLSNRALGYLLLDSAYNGKSDDVVALLKDEAPVDTVDENTGMTALHIAVGRNNLEIARILVERGASFIVDKQGRMPSTVAAECEVSEELCDFIAEAEARAEGV
jgi:ankyrin repeat protein